MKKIFRAGFILLIAMVASQPMVSAQDLGKLKKQADVYFENNAYSKALYYYTQYSNSKAMDRDARYRMGVASYEVNDLSQAQQIFSELITEKNFNNGAYFYLARLSHIIQDFDSAENLYKLYLKDPSTKGGRISIDKVRNYIRNCNVGNRLLSQPEEALVENLGKNINTAYDEFGAVQSPNYQEKIYFSSARKGSQGGLKNEQGFRDNEYGKYNSDLYFSKIDGGVWSPAEAMGGLLNSESKDVLLGFSQAGNVSYLFRGGKYDEGRLMVDTFNANQEEALPPRPFSSPINMEKGDAQPYFFNDSLVIFSSYRKGGYGGYDLYAMVKNGEDWMQPFNLGPEINSAFDEMSPFLSVDGRSLYFNSNNARKSLGGHDVFHARYNEKNKRWDKVKNMGIPINSSENDTDFYLSKDGTKAYMTSDRKSGFGERDIYIAYFKSSREEQAESMFPLTFIQLEDIEKRIAISQQIADGKTSSVGVSFDAEEEVVIPASVSVESVFYTSDRDLLSEANKRKIDIVTELLKLDNSLTLRIECHAAPSGPLPFDMYFSVKRAEKVAENIISQGIPARKIHVVGFGPLYPIAKNKINGIENGAGQKLNNRIDFKIQGESEAGIEVQYDLPIVSKFQADTKAAQLVKNYKGLTYKIQIASTTQLFDDDVLNQLPDPKVEKQMKESRYIYTIGTYRFFNSAVEFKSELVKLDIKDSKVIPYINGERIGDARGLSLIEKYPDLQEYFEGTK